LQQWAKKTADKKTAEIAKGNGTAPALTSGKDTEKLKEKASPPAPPQLELFSTPTQNTSEKEEANWKMPDAMTTKKRWRYDEGASPYIQVQHHAPR